MYVISGIASAHIIIGSLDQFVLHLFLGREQLHKKTRDVALLLPDLLYFGVPLYELCKVLKTPVKYLVLKKEFCLTISIVCLTSIFMKVLL